MQGGISEMEKRILAALLAHPGVRAKALKRLQPAAEGRVNCQHLLARLHRKGLVMLQDGMWYPTDAGRQILAS